MLNEQTIKRMKKLTEAHGAPGFEDDVREIMKDELSQFSDEIVYDGLGGIFAVKKSSNDNAKKVIIAAHMDEVGFMVSHIQDNGLLKFVPLGGWSTDVILAQKLEVKASSGDYYTGVVGSVPVHFRKQESKGGKPKVEDMLLDVGASSKEEVEGMGIELGDSIVPKVEFEQIGPNDSARYLAKAWDNRYGCLVAIEVLEALKDVQLDFDLYVGANVQEEVGLRGAKASSNMIKPDIAFVVDCSPANDMLGKDDDMGKLNNGTLLRIMDGTMILSPQMKTLLKSTADDHDIKYQYYRSPGGTDAGSIHLSNEGVLSAVVGICSRYIHTSYSIIDSRDYEAARSLLTILIKSLDDKKIESLYHS